MATALRHLRPSTLLRLRAAFGIFRMMMRDQGYRFPLKLKILAGIAAAYLIWPIDLIPDILPLLGFMDDGALFMGVMALLLEEIYKYEERIKGTVLK